MKEATKPLGSPWPADSPSSFFSPGLHIEKKKFSLPVARHGPDSVFKLVRPVVSSHHPSPYFCPSHLLRKPWPRLGCEGSLLPMDALFTARSCTGADTPWEMSTVRQWGLQLGPELGVREFQCVLGIKIFYKKAGGEAKHTSQAGFCSIGEIYLWLVRERLYSILTTLSHAMPKKSPHEN